MAGGAARSGGTSGARSTGQLPYVDLFKQCRVDAWPHGGNFVKSGEAAREVVSAPSDARWRVRAQATLARSLARAHTPCVRPTTHHPDIAPHTRTAPSGAWW